MRGRCAGGVAPGRRRRVRRQVLVQLGHQEQDGPAGPRFPHHDRVGQEAHRGGRPSTARSPRPRWTRRRAGSSTTSPGRGGRWRTTRRRTSASSSTAPRGAKLHVINVRWTGADGKQLGPPNKQPAFPGFKAEPLFGFTWNNERNDDNPETPEDEAAETQDLNLDGVRFGYFLEPFPLPALLPGLLGTPPDVPMLVPVEGEYSGPFTTLPPTLPDTGFLVAEATSSYFTSGGGPHREHVPDPGADPRAGDGRARAGPGPARGARRRR